MSGFLSRQGRLIHYTTTASVTAEVVGRAEVVRGLGDCRARQCPYSPLGLVSTQTTGMKGTAHPCGFPAHLLAGAQSDRDVVAEDQVRMAATERLPERPVTL